MKLRRLTRKRATDEVYEALRDAILTRGFKPGERLQVEEIAEKLGVSLTPVRHSVQRLCTEGLIEIRPRSGTFVATLTVEDIQSTFEVRCALECLAAELAIPRLSRAMEAEFDELLALLRQPVAHEESLRLHEEANSDLHQTLLQAAGNKRLEEVYAGLNAHLTIARIHASESRKTETPFQSKEWLARFAQEQGEHEEIVAALKAKHVQRAQECLRKHIYRAKDAMIASFAAVSAPATGRSGKKSGAAAPSKRKRSRS
ncbi:MAG: GntR family transcriptional regulator [Acidobacteria bacterium]|nr:GntR family transcriptional regulator [Acidobacteriota bacterium]